MTQEELRIDLLRLREEAPSSSSGTKFGIAGGCMLAASALSLALLVGVGGTATSLGLTLLYEVMYAALAVGVAGGVLLVIGIVKLIITQARTSAYKVRVEELERLIDEGDRAQPEAPAVAAPPPGVTFELVRF